MSDKPVGIAGHVLGEAKIRAAANETPGRKKIALGAGSREVEGHGVLLEGHARPDPHERDTLRPVANRAALLDRRTDVWLKRPATV